MVERSSQPKFVCCGKVVYAGHSMQLGEPIVLKRVATASPEVASKAPTVADLQAANIFERLRVCIIFNVASCKFKALWARYRPPR